MGRGDKGGHIDQNGDGDGDEDWGLSTAGGEEADAMFAELGWTEWTWKNWTSQFRKCLEFCDEEGS